MHNLPDITEVEPLACLVVAGGRKRLARKKVENALVLGPRLWTTDARAALLSFVLK